MGAVERVLAHGRARHGERAMSAPERIVRTSGRLMHEQVRAAVKRAAVETLNRLAPTLERIVVHYSRGGKERRLA